MPLLAFSLFSLGVHNLTSKTTGYNDFIGTSVGLFRQVENYSRYDEKGRAMLLFRGLFIIKVVVIVVKFYKTCCWRVFFLQYARYSHSLMKRKWNYSICLFTRMVAWFIISCQAADRFPSPFCSNRSSANVTVSLAARYTLMADWYWRAALRDSPWAWKQNC